MSTRFLALDPGGTTGWVFFDLEAEEFKSGHKVQWLEVADLLYDHKPNTVIVERFHIIEKRVYNTTYPPLYAIGAIHYLCHRGGIDIVFQNPSARKPISREQLLHVGWWTKGKGHANDAARHLYIYLRTKHPHIIERIMK